MGGKLGNIWPAAGSHHGVRGDQKPTKNDDETDSCNTYYPSWNASCGLRGPSWTAVFLDAMFLLPVSLPGTFLEPSRTFMDCGVSDKCVVFRVYLRVSLPGTFADLHGLRHF